MKASHCPKLWFVGVLASANYLVGCVATVDGSESKRRNSDSDSSSSSSDPGEEKTAAECTDAPIDPGRSPIRRLTRVEYSYTMHDLLGDDTAPGSQFPEEEIGLEFVNNADAQTVSTLLIKRYETAATDLATAAVADLPKLLGCDPATQGEDACVADFLPAFALKAFRRPLEAAELERYTGFYTTNKAAYGFSDAVRLTLQAILQSPNFIYRVENSAGENGSITKPTGYEMASRLSYLFWSSMPDKALFDAAASGALDTPEGIAEQAQRLFDDPRAHQSISSFFGQWLDLNKLDKIEKDPVAYPAFTTDVRKLLRQEADLLMNDVAFAGGGLQTLLLGKYSYMNQALAGYYGIVGPTGDTFQRVELDATRAAGFLTQATFGASNSKYAETAPIQRGLYVRERLLCDPPAPPPPNIPSLPPPDPNLTTRERLSQHRTEPACAGCHEYMDPIGLGFENYDAIGLWRDQENGAAVDASGEMKGSDDIDGVFNGALELATKLDQSTQVKSCVSKQWFRFGSGRGEGDPDGCTIVKLKTAFGDGDFKALILTLAQTDAFLYRTNQGAAQ